MNGAAAEHVLEVVSDQQHVFGGQEAFGRLAGRLTREQDDPERADDRRGYVLGPLHGGERHEARTVGEVRLDGTGSLEREPRLAHAARPRQRQQPDRCGAQSLADRCEVVLATDRAIRRRRQRAVAQRARRRPPGVAAVGRPAARGGWGIERGVVGEDRLVEVMQLGSRLDPELLDEDLARVAVGLQRVGLAAAAVQREHQLRVQPLAPRMLAS